MLLKSIDELRPTDQQCVIVNVSTKVFTTLALMGTLKYARMPVVVIDCESTDGSLALFQKLQSQYDFDILPNRRDRHGWLLDWLFSRISADRVLLIDSDLFFNGADLIDAMRRETQNRDVFASGCIHAGAWFKQHLALPGNIAEGIAYFLERPWIPCVMFRVEHVRRALAAKHSFIDRLIYNDIALSHRLSHLLYQRFRFPLLRNSRLRLLDPFRGTYDNKRPSYVYSDTGADVYQYLRRSSGSRFSAIPWEVAERSVVHFGGMTRIFLRQQPASPETWIEAVRSARERLLWEYQLEVSD
jgi:glycosyltransferase involved in cell wall biosynthesis